MKTVKSLLDSLFFSWKIVLILLIHYAVLLAAATIVEQSAGTAAAREHIYTNPLFFLLQLILVVSFVGLAYKHRLWQQKKYGVLVLHLSLIVILLGAMVTHLFGFEGIVHIREGETTGIMHQADQKHELPFTIRLNNFELVRYPGSNSPSSFESFLTISSAEGAREEHIYMNKVIYQQGYRIYQSSYDPDEQGTVLTVNHDATGTGITYAGYVLLLLGILMTLFSPHSRFQQLNKRLKQFTTLAFLLLSLTLQAQTPETNRLTQNTIPASHARKWGSLQVQCPTGRIEPVNTYTAKLLRKIYRSDSFEGLSSEQVMLGFMINPAYWSNVPFIRQTNKQLREDLALPDGKYIRFSDLFDNEGHYRIAKQVDEAYARPAAERSKLDKDLLKLDEKINILYSLLQGKLFSLFPLPTDSSGKWYSSGDDLALFQGRDSMFVTRIMPWYLDESTTALTSGDWGKANEVLDMIQVYQQKQSTSALLSEKQVSWELFYNRARLFFWSAISYALAGLLLLFVAILKLLTQKENMRHLVYILTAIIALIFLVHTTGIGIRWYLAGRPPVTNAYESMICVAWATTLAGLLFARRTTITLALAALLAGIILFVANLNFMDSEITPLVPVLKSYWLMIHVSVITASYGFFGISLLLGIVSQFFMAISAKRKNAPLDRKVEELRVINEMLLHIGLYLLTAGIFLGAIWANESWGRYWGWDPKETWALITMIIYALILHARFVPALRSDYAFSVMSILGFLTVLMTYFGVNYYFSGLHSYGSSETPLALYIMLVVYVFLALLMIYTACLRRKADKKIV